MAEPFDPTGFLSIASRLAVQGADEAALRTAVGRAYYAMFLLARDRLGVTTTEKAHGEVIRILTRRRKDLGDQLLALLNLRLTADYQMVPDAERNRDWRNNWVRAQKIVSVLQPAVERIR